MTNDRRRRAVWLPIGVAVASALLSMMVGTLPASGSAITSTDRITIPIPTGTTTFSNCVEPDGEVIDVTGTITRLFHDTIDDPGGARVAIIDKTRGQAIGQTTGDKYELISVGTQATNFGSGGSLATTIEIYLKLIGQGPANNTIIRVLGHLTNNADGTTTANVFNTSFVECR